jgi:hypothetical protein
LGVLLLAINIQCLINIGEINPENRLANLTEVRGVSTVEFRPTRHEQRVYIKLELELQWGFMRRFNGAHLRFFQDPSNDRFGARTFLSALGHSTFLINRIFDHRSG